MAKSQVTVRLDKAQLVRAKKALGTETVTETIERALALVTEKAVHDGIIRKYSGVGGIDRICRPLTSPSWTHRSTSRTSARGDSR